MAENRKDHRREVDKLLCDVVEELLALPRHGLNQEPLSRKQPVVRFGSFTLTISRELMERLLEAQVLCQDQEESSA